MKLTIVLDREVDGRWIAEVPELNVLLYGDSKQDPLFARRRLRGKFLLIESPGRSCLPSRHTPRSMSLHEFLAISQSASCSCRAERSGWSRDRTVGSHKIMKKDGWAMPT